MYIKSFLGLLDNEVFPFECNKKRSQYLRKKYLALVCNSDFFLLLVLFMMFFSWLLFAANEPVQKMRFSLLKVSKRRLAAFCLQKKSPFGKCIWPGDLVYKFSQFSTRPTTFVPSSLLACTLSPSKLRTYSKKERLLNTHFADASLLEQTFFSEIKLESLT